MDKIVDSVSNAIEKIYQSFIVRDLFGFVLPGAIALASLIYLVGEPKCGGFIDWLKTQINNAGDAKTLQVIIFIAASYLTAWVLQSVQYSLVDWFVHFFGICAGICRKINQWRRLRNKPINSPGCASPAKNRENLFCRCIQRLLWPLGGIAFYANRINETDNDLIINVPQTVQGALSPDAALLKVVGEDLPPRVQDSMRYTERASAVISMLGNTVMAGVLFLFAWRPAWNVCLIFGVVLLFVYLEHWRIWYARNLRVRIFASIQVTTTSESDSHLGSDA